MGRPKGSTNKAKGSTKAATAAPNPATVDLLQGIEFVCGALKPEGQPLETHIVLTPGAAMTFNGTFGYGIRLPSSDLTAVPLGYMLLAALRQCRGELQITQLDNDALALQAKGFKAFVNCLPNGTLLPSAPDFQIVAIDNTIRTALEIVSAVTVENAQRVIEAAALLQAGSAMATDGHLLMEYWHGHNVPSLVIPKASINKLVAIKRDLTGLGVSWDELGRPRSATFWFGEEAYFKTQLYIDEYPKVERITGLETKDQKKLPTDFGEALSAIDAFTNENGDVYFDTQSIRTQLDAVAGAVRDVDGELPPGQCYHFDLLALAIKHAKTVDWKCGDKADVAVFHGDNFRAFLMQRVIKT